MASIQMQEGTVRQEVDGLDDDGDAATLIAFADYTPASVHAVVSLDSLTVEPATASLTV